MTPLAFLLSRQLSFALAVSLVGARAAAQAPIAAPASAVPPDSVRPKPVVSVVEPPANAVARCTDGAFVIAVECTEPGATCFCTSMGCGPGAESGFDLAMTELTVVE